MACFLLFPRCVHVFMLQAKHAAQRSREAEGVVTFFPVMACDQSTWDTITAINRIQPSMRPTSKAKIQKAKVLLLSNHWQEMTLISPTSRPKKKIWNK